MKTRARAKLIAYSCPCGKHGGPAPLGRKEQVLTVENTVAVITGAKIAVSEMLTDGHLAGQKTNPHKEKRGRI